MFKIIGLLILIFAYGAIYSLFDEITPWIIFVVTISSLGIIGSHYVFNLEDK